MEAGPVRWSLVLVGGGLTVCCSPSSSVLLSADQTAAGNVGQRCRLTVAQRGIDMLPLSSLGTGQKRCHDGVARVQPSGEIGHGHSNLDGWPIPVTGDVHQPKLGFHHHIVSCALRVRARLAIASNGSIDEARVDLVDCIVVHAIFLESPRDVVFDENVALGRKLVEDLDACGVLKGQGERLFIPVDLGTVRAERV